MQAESPRKPRRRWLQFGLRSLLLATTVFGIWLGIHMKRVRCQQAAVQVIREFGGEVAYDFQETNRGGSSFFDVTAEPPVPKWLLDLVGEDFFFDVVVCNYANAKQAHAKLDRAKLDRASLLPLNAFPALRELYLRDGQATDEGLQVIGTLKGLKVLYLWDSPEVTDAGIAHLASLSQLEKIAVSNSQIGDDSLKVLGALPKIDKMILQFNHFSDRGLACLKNSRNLRHLSLDCGDTKFTDDGMATLGQLHGLEELSLQNMPLTSAGLDHLKNLKNLKRLNVFGTGADTSALRRTLPKCKINQ